MSQHIFEQDLEDVTYRVQIGWDRPLQNYYCLVCPWVIDPDTEEGGYFDEENPIWLSTEKHLFKKLDLATIDKNCNELGLSLPRDLLKNIQNDRKYDRGNVVQFYDDPIRQPTPTPDGPQSPIL